MQPRYFHTESPTPTTLLFTVSTRQPSHRSDVASPTIGSASSAKNATRSRRHRFLSRRVLSCISGTLRVLSAVFILMIEFAIFGREFFNADFATDRAAPRGDTGCSAIWSGRRGCGRVWAWALLIADAFDWRICLGVGLALLWLLSRRTYTEESLLALRSIGLQTTTSSPSYLTPSTTNFIPATQIQDIVIHEAFVGLEVKFYLSIIVKDSREVVVVFPKLLPSLEILEEVWRGSRKCLYHGG